MRAVSVVCGVTQLNHYDELAKGRSVYEIQFELGSYVFFGV